MRILSLALAGISLLGLMALSAYRLGFTNGREQGLQQALNTNPVSEELEMTCAGLWLGEQHKKHQQKGK